jgi:membrane associated rhomboid family serine protease
VIIGLCWLLLSFARLGAVEEIVLGAGFTPRLVSVGGAEGIARLLITPLTSTLINGGMFNILIDILGLLFCGRIVESIVGGRGMIILYLVGAYAAAAAHYAIGPNDTWTMIGAGGAVSAVIGAYAMLLGRNRLRVAGPRRGLWLNALWLAAAWIGLQALLAFAYGAPIGRITVEAFAGGFLAGLALAKPLLLLRWRGA